MFAKENPERKKSKMMRFPKIVNGFWPLTAFFEKCSILDVSQGSEYASISQQNIYIAWTQEVTVTSCVSYEYLMYFPFRSRLRLGESSREIPR